MNGLDKRVRPSRQHSVESLDQEGSRLDEQPEEELGVQWERAERTLLASGDLEWDEVGKTLRKKGDDKCV